MEEAKREAYQRSRSKKSRIFSFPYILFVGVYQESGQDGKCARGARETEGPQRSRNGFQSP